MFDHFKQVSRLSLNDKFLGDQGCGKLAEFIQLHGKVQALEIKSNDIGPEGFQLIFDALNRCPIRYIVAEYNNLGLSYEGVQQLGRLIKEGHKLEYLNIGSNKIEDGSLQILAREIANSSSLKLVELKFNSLTTKSVRRLIEELKRVGNKTLLFVDLSGNKIDKVTFDELEEILKSNRKLNPISRQKLQTINIKEPGLGTATGTSFLPQQSRMGATGGAFNNTFVQGLNTTSNGFGTMDMTSQNLVRHLQNVLDQSRRQTAQAKIRLQKQLQQLQRREKFDAKQLIDLDNNCNQLVLFNRNLKFQLDRCLSEQQQIQRDHSHQIRNHEQKVREANKQLSQLQSRYQQIQDRMNKQHIIRMKQLGRDWDNKLRALQDRIRSVQIQNNDIQNDIRKNLQKKERLKIQLIDEQNSIIQRVQQQQANRYNLRLNTLQSKLSQIQAARQLYLKRNNDIINQLQSMQSKNTQQILSLQSQIQQLKSKQQIFLQNNRQFISTNQKLSSQIKLKQLTFQKLQGQINSLNQQIQVKKKFNKEQIDRILDEQAYEKKKYQDDKDTQMRKLNQLEKVLRASQIENTRLRQEYIALAETVQMNVNKAIEDVFVGNNLY